MDQYYYGCYDLVDLTQYEFSEKRLNPYNFVDVKNMCVVPIHF